ncbi:hypothetical protein LINPERPRIM_LOCUS7745 [Linum perenne]
MRFWELLQRNR